jgi:hypothetical protein
VVSPAAARRAQGAWNTGGGLLLPVGNDKSVYEVLITLDVASMALLSEDE